MNIDDLLARTYDLATYNCAHFAEAVWFRATGRQVSLQAIETTGASIALRKRFRRAVASEYPRVVLMRAKGRPLHIAVALERDRVAHLRETGAVCLPEYVVTFGYTVIGSYVPC